MFFSNCSACSTEHAPPVRAAMQPPLQGMGHVGEQRPRQQVPSGQKLRQETSRRASSAMLLLGLSSSAVVRRKCVFYDQFECSMISESELSDGGGGSIDITL